MRIGRDNGYKMLSVVLSVEQFTGTVTIVAIFQHSVHPALLVFHSLCTLSPQCLCPCSPTYLEYLYSILLSAK